VAVFFPLPRHFCAASGEKVIQLMAIMLQQNLMISRAGGDRAKRQRRRRFRKTGGSVPASSAAPSSRWVLPQRVDENRRNHCWMVPARSFLIIASQRMRRSIKGIESAIAMDRAMPSIIVGIHQQTPVSSSFAAPANFDNTSTPGSAGVFAPRRIPWPRDSYRHATALRRRPGRRGRGPPTRPG